MRLLPWLFRFQLPIRIRWNPPPREKTPPFVSFYVMRPLEARRLTDDTLVDVRPLLVEIKVDGETNDEAMGYIRDLIDNGPSTVNYSLPAIERASD